MNNEKKQHTIFKRQTKEKVQIIESLRKTPIVEVACRRVGVSRATYYRWCGDDPKFKGEVEHALCEGIEVISDRAEANIIADINRSSVATAKWWLTFHRRTYMNQTRKDNSGILEGAKGKLLGLMQLTLRFLSLTKDKDIKEAKKELETKKKDVKRDLKDMGVPMD